MLFNAMFDAASRFWEFNVERYAFQMATCVPWVRGEVAIPDGNDHLISSLTHTELYGTWDDPIRMEEKFPLNLLPTLDVERNWRSHDFLSKLPCYPNAAPWAGFVGVAFYLLVVHGGQWYMQDKKPWDLRGTMRAWNLFLAVFSLWGAVRTMPHLLYSLFLHNDDSVGQLGWTFTICANAHRSIGDGVVGFAAMMFIYSKFAEFLDTVILVLRKKPVSFLHWYHHASVLLFCWDAYSAKQPSGIWFIAMNYSVHAVMYFYYFLTAFGYRPRWAGFVTSMQILQMVIGMLVTFVHYYMLTATDRICSGSVDNLHFCFGMYLSYFFLFMNFAVRRYFFSKKPVSRRPQTPQQVELVRSDKTEAETASTVSEDSSGSETLRRRPAVKRNTVLTEG